MPVETLEQTSQPAAAPSMADLRQLAGRTQAAAPVSRETPEAEANAEEEITEAEPGTAHETQQAEEEFELPPGVQKRIAAEAKKAAFFQSKIDKAVSERKAREAEAAKITDKSGSEPAKTTESATERPKRPDLASFSGTLAEYNTAVEKYEEEREEWLKSETRRTVTQELRASDAEKVRKQEWDAASKEHGADFPKLMDSLAESTPAEFQIAVSALDDWAAVAVHLAKNEAERDALVELFKANPARGAAELGKLEDRIKPAAKHAASETRQLPRPVKQVAGGALGIAPKVDLDKAPMSQFKAEVRRMRGDK